MADYNIETLQDAIEWIDDRSDNDDYEVPDVEDEAELWN